jgi:hypothetical protein
MANRSEAEKILEVAVAGIPRIAKVIADFPIEFREGALEVAERRYQQTVCDLGYAEGDAQGWISVVMFRLRRQVAELSAKKLDGSGSEAEKSVEISKGRLAARQRRKPASKHSIATSERRAAEGLGAGSNPDPDHFAIGAGLAFTAAGRFRHPASH